VFNLGRGESAARPFKSFRYVRKKRKGRESLSPLGLKRWSGLELPGNVNVMGVFPRGSGEFLHALILEKFLYILGDLLILRMPVVPDGGSAMRFTAEVDVIGGADGPDIDAPVAYDLLNSCLDVCFLGFFF